MTSWTKVKKRAKQFLTGKLKEVKPNLKACRMSINWNVMHKEMKKKGISITNNQNLYQVDWNGIHKEMVKKGISITNKQVN